MSTRVALVCSLVLLAACEERLLGSAREMVLPEGGLEPSQEDDLLAQYAHDLQGEWHATSPDRGAFFTIDFMQDELRERSGIVRWKVQLDCNIAVPAFFPLPVPPCLPDRGERDPPQFPQPSMWEAEYWVLKSSGSDALVAMLPEQAEGLSLTCNYVPKPPPAQIECGVTIFGAPLGSTIFTRPVR